jgi:hypothetical protein
MESAANPKKQTKQPKVAAHAKGQKNKDPMNDLPKIYLPSFKSQIVPIVNKADTLNFIDKHSPSYVEVFVNNNADSQCNNWYIVPRLGDLVYQFEPPCQVILKNGDTLEKIES